MNASILHLPVTVLPRGCSSLTDKIKLLDWNVISSKKVGFLRKISASGLPYRRENHTSCRRIDTTLRSGRNLQLSTWHLLPPPLPPPPRHWRKTCTKTYNHAEIYSAWLFPVFLTVSLTSREAELILTPQPILIKSICIVDFVQWRQSIDLIFQLGGCTSFENLKSRKALYMLPRDQDFIEQLSCPAFKRKTTY